MGAGEEEWYGAGNEREKRKERQRKGGMTWLRRKETGEWAEERRNTIAKETEEDEVRMRGGERGNALATERNGGLGAEEWHGKGDKKMEE